MAPPGLGVRDARTGSRGCALETFSPVGRYVVTVVIDRVVVAEVPLALVRDQPKDADVRVGHARAPDCTRRSPLAATIAQWLAPPLSPRTRNFIGGGAGRGRASGTLRWP